MKCDVEKTRIVQFYAGALVLLVGLLSAGYFFTDQVLRASARHDRVTEGVGVEKAFITDMAYVDLPEITFSFGGGASHVHLDIALEVARDDVPALEGYVPQIVDRFNAFFPHVSFENMGDPAFVFFLRRDLLRQVRLMGIPIPVRDLLLHKLLVL